TPDATFEGLHGAYLDIFLPNEMADLSSTQTATANGVDVNNATIVRQLKNQVEQLNSKVQNLESIITMLENGTREALKKYDKAEADNELLRSQILGMMRSPGPTYDDGHYFRELESLNERIQG